MYALAVHNRIDHLQKVDLGGVGDGGVADISTQLFCLITRPDITPTVKTIAKPPINISIIFVYNKLDWVYFESIGRPRKTKSNGSVSLSRVHSEKK